MRRLVQAFVLLSMTATAHAQDTGRVGLTMGYPAAIGVVWHVSERVAVRPELSWSDNSSESTSTVTFTIQGISNTTTTRSTSDGWTVGVGASGLFYMRKSDGLSTYVSPRVMYTRSVSSTSSSNATGSLLPQPTEFRNSGYLASGSFGAQYALGRRFGVFGEIGLAYSRSTNSNNLSVAGNNSSRTISTRSGAGVLFYF
jgi:opacity protein-like surface antigen